MPPIGCRSTRPLCSVSADRCWESAQEQASRGPGSRPQRWRDRPRAPDWSASRQPDMQTASRMGKGGQLARPPVIRLFDSLRAGWPGPAPAPPPRARALALPRAWRRSLARPGSPGSVSKSILPTAVRGAVCLRPHAWQRFSRAGEDSRPAFSGRGRKRFPLGGWRDGPPCQQAGSSSPKHPQKPARVFLENAGGRPALTLDSGPSR